MTQENLRALLDTTYELEGLLHLALNRDDNREAIGRLIRQKIRELAGEDYDVGEQYVSPDAESDILTYAEEDDDEGAREPMEESLQPEQPEVADEEPVEHEKTEPQDYRRPEREGSAPAFSLNDKFLFTRELFGGSRKLFDEAVIRLASMESLEEAESYFYDELNWNPEDETVVDFMGIAAKYLGR